MTDALNRRVRQEHSLPCHFNLVLRQPWYFSASPLAGEVSGSRYRASVNALSTNLFQGKPFGPGASPVSVRMILRSSCVSVRTSSPRTRCQTLFSGGTSMNPMHGKRIPSNRSFLRSRERRSSRPPGARTSVSGHPRSAHDKETSAPAPHAPRTRPYALSPPRAAAIGRKFRLN